MSKKVLGNSPVSESGFPKVLEEFRYKYNENGELRHIETDERFIFYVKPDDFHYNQSHYEALEAVGKYIEEQLVSSYKLIKKDIPLDSTQPKSRIYCSDDYDTCSTLLLLMQGSGVVRPGQWARQVVINESLELGSMFPYIKKARELGWGVLIFNPNENFGDVIKDGEIVDQRPIKGSESPLQHTLYVWDNFIRSVKSDHILMVSHSFGGISTTALLDRREKEFKSLVKRVAFTDTVHSAGNIPTHSKDWFMENTKNWIKSERPLDTPVQDANGYFGCRCISAGHPKHEYTSGTAIESVFEFLKGKLENETIEPDISQAQQTETQVMESESLQKSNMDDSQQTNPAVLQGQLENDVIHEQETSEIHQYGNNGSEHSDGFGTTQPSSSGTEDNKIKNAL
ncbi:hypothetical protein G9A89_018795 [Geosiphon pyriformis]|nr:hypothetical protein G9A89_018795 [Geosiphon pyriformis]